MYNFIQYGVDKETEMLDYDLIRKQVLEEKPKLVLSGYTAYPRKIDFKEFRNMAKGIYS
jgi:glycine hydroxymethyltransferase